MSLLALFKPEPWTLNCSTQVSFKTSDLLWPLRKSATFFIFYPRCSDSNPSNTCNNWHMSRADRKSRDWLWVPLSQLYSLSRMDSFQEVWSNLSRVEIWGRSLLGEEANTYYLRCDPIVFSRSDYGVCCSDMFAYFFELKVLSVAHHNNWVIPSTISAACFNGTMIQRK